MSVLPPGKPGFRAAQRATTTPEGITAVDTWTIYTPEGEYAVTAANIHMALGTWEQEHHVNAAEASVLAVVNDGRRTVLYVDGSRIARNPTQPSTGIATLGKPFVLGATQFDESYGQGLYGSLGDTRIVNRALPVRDFLTPFD